MFTELTQKLLLIPTPELLATYGVVVFLTCFSILPNSNDLLLAAASLVIKAKGISLAAFIATAFVAWALGENAMFFIGHFAGKKLMKSTFVRKKISDEAQFKIRNLVNENSFHILLSLRITPILRAYLIMTLGGVGLKPSQFVRIHLVLLLLYISLVSALFFFLGHMIEEHLGEHKIVALTAILLVWIGSMIWVGKRSEFLSILKSKTNN